MPSPAPEKEEPLAMIQTGCCLSGEQFCWIGPGGLGGQWVVLEPAVSHGSREVNSILGCIKRSTTRRSREGIIPFYSTLMRLHREYCMQFWLPQYKKDIDKLEQVHCGATKLIWAGRTWPVRELGLFSLEKASAGPKGSLSMLTRRVSRRWSQALHNHAWVGRIRGPHEDSQAVELVAQQGWAASILRGFQPGLIA